MSEPSGKNRAVFPFVLSLIWLMVVLAFYFMVHKPAEADQLKGVLGWLPGLLLAMLLTLVAAAFGHRLLARTFDDASRSILALGLGLGLFSLAGLLLGLSGFLRSEWAWLLLAIAAIIGLHSLRPWWRDLQQLFAAVKPTTRFARLALWYCVFVLAIALLQSLAPPTAWDGLAYHLKGPDLYLNAGRITHAVDNPYLGFPQFGEMLFLFAQLLGVSNPTIFHWLFAAATTLLIAAQAQKVWGPNAGWFAAAIFLSAETVVLEAGWPYVDLTLAFQILAAFVCLQLWQTDRAAAKLIGAGLFAGLAIATKYLAAPVIIGFSLIVLLHSSRPKFRAWLIFSLAAGLAAAPWFLKIWLTTGNPVYPFVFGGSYWDSIRAQAFGGLGHGLPLMQVLTAPWDATIWGVEGKVGYTATIGPLWLMLLPIVWLAWPRLVIDRRQLLIDALIISSVAYLSWLIGLASSTIFMQTRLVLLIFPLLAIVAAGSLTAAARWSLSSISLPRIITVLVSTVWLATGLKIGLDFSRSNVLPVLTGGQARADYLTEQLGWYYVTMQTLNDLGTDTQVLFLWEPRSLYCHVDCQPDSLLDRWWHARQSIGSIDQIADRWQADGVQYVLLYQQGYRAATDLNFSTATIEDQPALDQLISQRLDLVRDFGGVYQLFRWRIDAP
jgi:hypothetical protein